ncbi:MAG TPA: phosphate acyltransferase PlsX [Hyphomicrobiales bacterium]|nr:phosphate acyltransferase PlsX [Rhodobiaceae bacterium]HXK54030.1 phosphate acyltransferase PlsX [Hyphomicrobiales bacterium]
MSGSVIIALDAMGGDFGPEVIIPGAALALERHPDLRFRLYGDEARVAPLLGAHPKVAAASELVHTDVAVKMDDKPSQALRRGRWRSSMWLTLDAVKNGEADVAVSAGNTGALMAMARFNLRTLADIDRPAIAAIWPTLRGESIVLDVGATIGADSQQLIDFAVMGEAMARALFGIERPSVGLLNIGVEEVKGLDAVREAHQMLLGMKLPMDYKGFVEGTDLGKGTVDVVVTEGFSGNIALKTAEGTARQISEYLKAAMRRTLAARIGYLLARGAFAALKDKMDPRKANGGVFLGLNGIVIKSHGGTDAEGFASAVVLGYEMARNGLLEKIVADLGQYHSERRSSAGSQANSVAS